MKITSLQNRLKGIVLLVDVERAQHVLDTLVADTPD